MNSFKNIEPAVCRDAVWKAAASRLAQQEAREASKNLLLKNLKDAIESADSCNSAVTDAWTAADTAQAEYNHAMSKVKLSNTDNDAREKAQQALAKYSDSVRAADQFTAEWVNIQEKIKTIRELIKNEKPVYENALDYPPTTTEPDQ